MLREVMLGDAEDFPSLEESTGRLNKYNLGGPPTSRGPRYLVYFLGKFSWLYSVYTCYEYLQSTQTSIIPLVFWTMVGSAVAFLALERPWKGRPLLPSQFQHTVVNGAVLAFGALLFAHALHTAGPIRTIVADYSGFAIGGLAMLLLSQRGYRGRKARGVLCILAAFYMFSRGWATSSSSLLSSLQELVSGTRLEQSESADAGHVLMIVPIAAGLMNALRRLLARRVALRAMAKRRFHAITVAIAALCLFPVYVYHLTSTDEDAGGGPAMRARVYLINIVLGTVLHFYIDSFGEAQLKISLSSFRNVTITLGSVGALELIRGMDFSVLGFTLCSVVLAVGVQWASSLEPRRRDSSHASLITGGEEDRRRSSSIPKELKGPVAHMMADQKSRRIALFLLINTAFMVVEFVYGFVSNSLGLISDAVHMLFDCAALVVGLYASYIARLPATSAYPYGYGRYEVLAGYANAVFLVFVATLIVLESLERILEPPDISTDKLMAVSVGGFLVNMVGLVFFHDAHHHAHGGSCPHGDGHAHGEGHHHHEGKVGGVGSIDDLLARRHEEEAGHCHGLAHHGASQKSNNVLAVGDGQGAAWRADGTEAIVGSHSHESPNGHGHHHAHKGGAASEHCHHHKVHDHGVSDMAHDGAQESPCLHHHEDCCDGGSRLAAGHEKACDGRPEARCSHSIGHHHAHGQEPNDGSSRHHCQDHELDHAPSHDHGDHHHEHDHGGHHHEHDHGDHHHDEHDHGHLDHNMRGIFLHVLADTLGSVGVIISTFLIQYKGWVLADPACSIFISIMIVSSVVPLLQNAGETVLQRVPGALCTPIQQALDRVSKIPGVAGWQRPHFWSFTPAMSLGSLRVLVGKDVDKQQVCRHVKGIFSSFGLRMVAVQVEDESSLGLTGASNSGWWTPR